MSKRSPAPPPSLPEEMPPPRSRYNRPRRFFSIWGLVIGLILGMGGGLAYAWTISPVVELSTEPWQLRVEDRAHYMVAITLAFAGDSDLNRAVERLLTLQGQNASTDIFQQVADTACRLASTGYVDSNSGLAAIRSMMQFYQLQGRSGCADTLIPANDIESTAVVVIDASTPTLPPPATKTPTPPSAVEPSPTAPRVVVPTSVPQRDFVLANVSTFCDAQISGVIEVFVQDFGGVGIAGMPVRVRWDSGDDTFFTGLKPERGPAYADFEMEAGKGYIIDMPGRSDPSSQQLVAAPCTTDAGRDAVTSYRVVFLPAS
ncbi:MAG: hypothetical protein CL610_17630 [Anaerolineaceae bacterium]|nr:hypothetical protein [Anaerolineaceae bacterium]